MLLSLFVAVPTLLAPATPLAEPIRPTAAVSYENIEWFQGQLFAIRGKAQSEGKGILFVVYTDESSWCDKLFKTTFKDAQVIAEMRDLICVKVNLTRGEDGKILDPIAEKISSRFPVASFPTLLYLGVNLQPEDLVEGFIPAANLTFELQRMKAGTNTLSAFRDAAEAAPDDIEAVWNLAMKVNDFGYTTEYVELMKRVAELDPNGRSRPVRAQQLLILQEQLFRAYAKDGVYDIPKMTAFLEAETNPTVAFDGWSTLAGLVRNLRDSVKSKKEKRAMGALARESHQEAWQVASVTGRPSYAATVLNDFFEDRSELKNPDRKFVSKVAEELDTLLEGRKDPAVVEAAFCDARACASAIAKKPKKALEWIDLAIELDPATPRYGKRRDELLAKR